MKIYLFNIYILYEINLQSFKQSVDFTLGSSLFGAGKLTKNANFDKIKDFGYAIGFDARGIFWFSDSSVAGLVNTQ